MAYGWRYQTLMYRIPSMASDRESKRPANYVGTPADNIEDKRTREQVRADDRREQACEILDEIQRNEPELGPAQREFVDDLIERRAKWGVRFLVSENTLSWLEDIAEEFDLL
jgi:hypothetical protein